MLWQVADATDQKHIKCAKKETEHDDDGNVDNISLSIENRVSFLLLLQKRR